MCAALSLKCKLNTMRPYEKKHFGEKINKTQEATLNEHIEQNTQNVNQSLTQFIGQMKTNVLS